MFGNVASIVDAKLIAVDVTTMTLGLGSEILKYKFTEVPETRKQQHVPPVQSGSRRIRKKNRLEDRTCNRCQAVVPNGNYNLHNKVCPKSKKIAK